jgi:cytochrome c-type biogenesis protein CcmH/NrfF
MTTRSPGRRRALFTLLLAAVLGTAGVGSARAEDPPPADLTAAAQSEKHVDDPASADQIKSAPAVAQRLFRDLVCLCGGCKRETLDKCPCSYARAEREKILAMLSGKDIGSDAAQEKAYVEVRDAIIKEYGGQHVLVVPIDAGFNKLAWIVPWVVFALALTLVVVVGRRWVTRGRKATAAAHAGAVAAGPAPHTDADEEREERLDDELRDID